MYHILAGSKTFINFLFSLNTYINIKNQCLETYECTVLDQKLMISLLQFAVQLFALSLLRMIRLQLHL